MKPKPMKPVKAWAAVDDEGTLAECFYSWDILKLRWPGCRIVRVEIREVNRAEKSH